MTAMAAITHDVSSMGNSGSQYVLDLPCGVDGVCVCIVHVIRESLVVCMGVGEGYVQACSVQDMTVERYEREVYISKVPL